MVCRKGQAGCEHLSTVFARSPRHEFCTSRSRLFLALGTVPPEGRGNDIQVRGTLDPLSRACRCWLSPEATQFPGPCHLFLARQEQEVGLLDGVQSPPRRVTGNQWGRKAGGAGWTGLAGPQGHRERIWDGVGCGGDVLFHGRGCRFGSCVTRVGRIQESDGGAQSQHQQGGRGRKAPGFGGTSPQLPSAGCRSAA